MYTIGILSSPTPWYVEWVPIFIAICALIVSVASLYWSRIQFREDSRPFMWLIDFASVNQQQVLINHPETFAMRITNAPALVRQAKYNFYILSGETKDIIDSHQDANFVKFPDSNSQYTYTVGNFRERIQQCQPSDNIERCLRIEYSALSKGKKYYYESLAKYDFIEERWRTISEKAS